MAEQSSTRQLGSLWAKLSKAQQFTIIGSGVLALGLVAFLIFSTGGPEMSVLYSGLDEKDAAAIVEKLQERQIPYELKGNGGTIHIPADQVRELRLAMASEGLPQNSVVGYEIFDRTNLGMSDFVQKLNYRRALEGELSRTISSLDEVSKARVHIVVPEKQLFEKDQKKPTASVILQLKSGRNVSRLNVEGIQNLVSSSIEGLESSAVTVIDQKGKILSEPVKDRNSLVGMSETQYELQQKVDQYLSSKAQTMLDGVLGAGNSVVRVNADLDFTQVEKTIEDFDPDKQVVRSEQRIDENSKSVDSLSYPAVNSQSQRGNNITNYEISKTVEKIVSNGGAIKRISIAGLVNGVTKVDNTGAEPKLDYKPRSDEEMQKLTQIIKNAVGFDPNRNDQVSVENVQFDPTQLEEELLQMQPQKFPLSVPQMIEIGMIVLAMILAIFMVRRLIGSKEVRRRIEHVLTPPRSQEEEIAEIQAQLSGKVVPLLPQTIVEDIDESQLPEGVDRDKLLSQARAKLDASMQSELSEEALLAHEMKVRVEEYVNQRPDEAVRLVKIILAQDEEASSGGRRR